ncbi:hypothetical protein K788_0001810 (plasmid) [Paraburkholderia caribensis MBA4]|uniref:Uncharacterized protein n=1 Tax=Paraburkholderia caribensis MBA4 TaxID=1323664 RepID=A0A0P0RR66_9BURK|nr:hypothetical protein [Paraburkholderia caribensis]ALL71391.1 hypothetical protein K788_0001810 [Paraburkholderia caribensis MBA4]
MADEYTAGMWIDTNIDNGVANQIAELVECCTGSGSIGCFAQNSAGKPVLLSCQHVLFPNDLAPSGAATFQPRFSSCCSGNEIARQWIDPQQFKRGRYMGGYMAPPNWAHVLVRWRGVQCSPSAVPNGFAPSVTDCAMAVLNMPGMKFRNIWKYKVGGQVKEVPLKGFYSGGYRDAEGFYYPDFGVNKGPPFGTLPAPADYLRVYSERLGRVVYGTALSLAGGGEAPPPEDPQRLRFVNGIGSPDEGPSMSCQLMFLPRPDPDPSKPTVEMAYKSWAGTGPDHGDSGTMVINADNMIVGMITTRVTPSELFSEEVVASTWELRNVNAIALFTPIQDIVTLLKVTIPGAPNPWASSVPAHGSRILVMNPSEQTLRQSGFARLREGLQRSRRGRLILGKINVHGRELRFMFQRVRELAASWKHVNGPAFMHHGLRSVCEPGHVVPQMIDGVSRRDLLEAVLPIIERHASPRLRRDLVRYRAWAVHVLLSVQTVDEVIDVASNR